MKSIVIVDDEMVFTTLLGNLIKDYFTCPVHTFEDPEAALAALPSLNVGVLVTDYYMPRLDGLRLLQLAGEILSPPPASIVITAHMFEDGEVVSGVPHLKMVLPKPFRCRELAALIQRYWPAGEEPPLRRDASGAPLVEA